MPAYATTGVSCIDSLPACGDSKKKRAMYRKSVELNPDSASGRAALGKLNSGE